MALDPRTRDEIYQSLKNTLQGRISGLTNFAENTFNYIWTQAFSEALHRQEVAATAIQLSGWIDYAGKELTQEDLNALGIEGIEPEEINQYMSDEHLDELGKEVGVYRDRGTPAEGEVVIETTNDTVSISSGTVFGTQPDSDGNFLTFQTTEEVQPESGETTVTAPVQAQAVGEEYNVGSDTITYMPNPPNGVQSVTNPMATQGGRGRESNASLRRSIKNALFEQSGGGTESGLRGYIETTVEGVESVSVDEFTDANPIYVDVVVDGGPEQDVKDAIDYARPLGIRHNLVRPDEYHVNIIVEVTGGNIDTTSIENTITTYVSTQPLGGSVIRDKLIQRIMNSDDDIDNILTLNVEVSGESHTFDGSQVYTLNKGPDMANDGIVEVTGRLDGSAHTFVKGTDYEEVDSGSGTHDAIDWSIGGDSPDEGTDFEVTYRIDDDLSVEGREKTTPNTITATVN